MAHRSGFVNIFGFPNVGKSTLMNALLGEKLSIITPKAQTTRHRIIGLLNGDDYQVVFSDTPGIIPEPGYLLQEAMMNTLHAALADADVVVYISQPDEAPAIETEFLSKIARAGFPLLICLNKIDLTSQDVVETLISQWKQLIPRADVIPISALHGFNTDGLLKHIVSLLPENPPYYPKDDLSDRPERFFVAEIIREKVLLNYHREIPYSVEVVINSFQEQENIVRIEANLLVARESQKGILIGHQGKALKKTGTTARLEIEKFLGKKVFLELFVKVKKDWRDNERDLNRFGYL